MEGATDYVRFVHLQKPSIIALKGVVSEKATPQDYIFENCKEVPDTVSSTLDELVYPGNWKPLVDSIFHLPSNAEEGEIHPTTQGYLCIFSKGSWVVIGNAL